MPYVPSHADNTSVQTVFQGTIQASQFCVNAFVLFMPLHRKWKRLVAVKLVLRRSLDKGLLSQGS